MHADRENAHYSFYFPHEGKLYVVNDFRDGPTVRSASKKKLMARLRRINVPGRARGSQNPVSACPVVWLLSRLNED